MPDLPTPPPPGRREGRFARLRRIWNEAGVTDRTHVLRPSGPRPRASTLPNPDDHTPLELRSRVDTSWLPPNAAWLAVSEKGRLPIVGESNYQAALRLGVDCDVWGVYAVAAMLRTEPDNRYDPDAVAVDLVTGLAGYIARTELPYWRPIIAAQEEAGRTPVATAAIIGGGWDHEEGAEHGYGVWLHVHRHKARQKEACDEPVMVR